MSFNIEDTKLNKTVEQLNDKCEELESAIEQIEDFKDEFQSKIKSLQNTINLSEINTADINTVITKLNSIISSLKSDYSNLKSKLEAETNKLDNSRLTAFKSLITNITIEQCMVCEIKPNTKTVNLLDEFCSSNKDFLILKNAFYFSRNRTFVSLIISRKFYGLDIENSQPTMSEIKKEYGKNVSYLEATRLQPLRKTLQNLDQSKSFSDGEIFAFDVPFLIGGQTSSNKTGYGTTWYGWGDYIEGTLYGEVTDFILTGIITNSTYFHLKSKQKPKDSHKNISAKQNQKSNQNTKKVNDTNGVKDFPLFLMENIVMLCLSKYLHPIETINKAIEQLDKDINENIKFDKLVHNAFATHLKDYLDDFDYVAKFLYKISILLDCSIVRIITLKKSEREKIAKNFIDDNRYHSDSMGYGIDTDIYYLLPDGKKYGEQLITADNNWFNTSNKFPIYSSSKDEAKYFENTQELFIEDYRAMIFFSSYNYWHFKPFKYNLYCSFYIYYHQEYMQYKKEPLTCLNCNHLYSETYNSDEKHGSWLCPNCSTTNSIFDKYQFREFFLTTDDELKKYIYVPIQP